MVYLVGAGPGDPGLITVRGLELLRRADVVLHDSLIGTVLLTETKPGCEIVDVGKNTGIHTVPQEKTMSLLVHYGQKNIDVVRLKGGDPFMFGRGGEEAQVLKKAGIPFEIIPGISALNGASCYSGIPLTHRDYSSSITSATGHGADGKNSDPVKWREIASASGTVVVFMGMENLEHIVSELVVGGFDTSTPAALIHRATTPAQKVLTGTLDNIASKVKEQKITPPSLFFAGNTVQLAKELGWYKAGKLGGMTIGITRPLEQSRKFHDLLLSNGAYPIIMPTIRTEDMIENPVISNIMTEISKYDYIVFASANGVSSFFRALRLNGKDIRALKARFVCIGPATAETLAKHNAFADIIADRYIAEGIIEKMAEMGNLKEKKVLFARSNMGRNVIVEGLSSLGAEIEEASFYSTLPAELNRTVVSLLKKGGINMLTFTSSSTVEFFFSQFSPEDLPGSVKLASIGPQTSATLNKFGLEPDIISKIYTTEGLAEAIIEAYGK